MKKNLISVIINNYNYADYVGYAIKSVLNQTYENYELIIVDDGSTDNSREIIESFSNESKVKIILQENKGQASAINAGFTIARGKYVFFLDSDDLFDSDKIERMLPYLESENCSVVQHQLRVIDKLGEESDKLFPPLQLGSLDVLPLYFKFRNTSYYSATSGIAAPRRILRRIFPLPEEDWKICADAPLTRPLALFGNIYTMKTPAGSYRIHGDNNWINTELRHKTSSSIQTKTNNYTNQFLRRWGILKQIEIPVPYAQLLKHHIKKIAIYGAGQHTHYLLETQNIADKLNIIAIIDDNPSIKEINGIEVLNSDQFVPKSCDVVLVSSDTFETTMTQNALKRGWANLLTIYSIDKFIAKTSGLFNNLNKKLSQKGKSRIALYGAGFHSLNILLSKMISDDIKVVCILDENPLIKQIWNVPVFHPSKVDRSSFDAVILSSEVYEYKMFYQARDYGFDSIFLLYGSDNALKMHRADYEEIRNKISSKIKPKVAIYDPSWFTQALIQGPYLEDAEIVCILSENEMISKSLYDIPLYCREQKKLPYFDLLVIPPKIQKTIISELEHIFGDKIFIISENINEINIIYSFLQKNSKSSIMIDVGANLGQSLLPFAKENWRIHAFEPDSIHREKLIKTCKHYSNVSISPFALSDQADEKISLYRSKISGGISGLTVFHKSHYFSEYINTMLLSKYVTDSNLENVDFLKIDTEGYDLFVLKGNCWDKFRPRVILCEFENYKTEPLGYDFHDIAGYLIEQGYELLISEWDPVIEYGNQPRWRRFISYPCDLLDPEASGNIIAFCNKKDLEIFQNDNQAYFNI